MLIINILIILASFLLWEKGHKFYFIVDFTEEWSTGEESLTSMTRLQLSFSLFTVTGYVSAVVCVSHSESLSLDLKASTNYVPLKNN